MGRRGPPPKPDQLKRLEGNPGGRRLKSSADEPDVEIPRCPEIVASDEVALAMWKELAHELHRLRLIARINAPVLAALCVHWARWRRAEEKIRECGEVIETDSGYLQQSAWLTVANKAYEQFLRAAQEFGMTPSSYSRVIVQTGGKLPQGLPEEDEFNDYIAGAPGSGERATH